MAYRDDPPESSPEPEVEDFSPTHHHVGGDADFGMEMVDDHHRAVERGGADLVYREDVPPRTRRNNPRCALYIGAAVVLVLIVVIAVMAVVLASSGKSTTTSAAVNGPATTTGASGGSTNNKPSTSSGSSSNDNNNNVGISNNNSPRPPPTTQSEMEVALRSLSRYGGSEFDDSSTYQYKALQWLLEHPVTVDGNGQDASQKRQTFQERSVQRFALACIYYATYQVPNQYTAQAFAGFDLLPWNDQTNWLTADNECTWFGIVCNAAGWVTDIRLEKNALTGTFPYEVAYLGTSLRILNLDQNFFHNADDEGHEFLLFLPELRLFSARDTYLQYSGFPSQFAHLRHLESLDVSYVVYMGAIPDDLFTADNPLVNLTFWDISGNSFYSPIPTSVMAALPSLKAFYAMNSNIQGDLNFLTYMTAAEEVWIDQNPLLSGAALPSNMNQMTALRSFSATQCNLLGSIPSSLGQLVNLTQVWLYHNALTGTIPTELGQLEQLKTFEVVGNALSGTMPTQVCANHRPMGALQSLQADCPDAVVCDCCDCCGPTCAKVVGSSDINSGGGSGGSDAKKPGNRYHRRHLLQPAVVVPSTISQRTRPTDQ